jgi:hypothetical protein
VVPWRIIPSYNGFAGAKVKRDRVMRLGRTASGAGQARDVMYNAGRGQFRKLPDAEAEDEA